MKVIANHVLDPRIVIAPNAGASDRSWVWTAYDFAEGELVEKVRKHSTIYIIINFNNKICCLFRYLLSNLPIPNQL